MNNQNMAVDSTGAVPVTIVNLTPHALNIAADNGEVVTIPPSGTVARVETDRHLVNWMPVNGHIIEVYEPNFGEIVGLPERQPYTAYVVSAQVAQRTERSDVYSPGELVRNEAGQVIGCNGLTFHKTSI